MRCTSTLQVLVASAGLALSAAAPAMAAQISGEGRISGAQTTARTGADVAIHVGDPARSVAAANNFATQGKQAMLYSGDGGTTWDQSYLPQVANDWSHFGAGVGWTSDDTAWVATSASELRRLFLPSLWRIRVYKSTDGGATWLFAGTPSALQENARGPSLRVDHGASSSFTDSVYVLWGLSAGSDDNVYSSYQRTPGGAWSTPLKIDGAETTKFAAASGVETNDRGDVFAFWRDIGPSSSRKLFVAKSSDGGASFGTPSQIAFGFTDFTGGVPASPGVGASFSGSAHFKDLPLPDADLDDVYAAWTDLSGETDCTEQDDWPGSNPGSTCKTRIWFSRSTDGGATWETAKKLADPSDLNDQFGVQLAVDAATGTIAVVYRDTIADPTRRQTDVWYQSSHDRGVTWSAPLKVTSAPTDQTGSGAVAGYWQLGLSGHDDVFRATWTDRRNGGVEEIWSAKIYDPACAPPGAPAIGTATPGTNQVELTWAHGSPASESFDLHRAVGGCSSPGSFTRIASGLAGSPHVDAGVSGGVPYAYSVTGRDTTGVCESAPSGCVEATPTGACTLPPAFTGLATATSPGDSLCTIDLAWAAATAYCGGPVTYDVHRSTTAGFAPSPANRIATGLTGTSYSDISPLHQGGTYHYLVRAVDEATDIADANMLQRTATPLGSFAAELPAVETFEATDGFDHDGWQHSIEAGSLDWVWTNGRSQSGAHSWHSPNHASLAGDAGRVLDSPEFTAQAGTRLTFWHTYSFRDPSFCSEGGALEVSTNGGGTWSPLPPAALEVGGYNGARFPSGDPSWCGGALGLPSLVMADLSAYAGPDTRVRWHASQSGSGWTGWYVDSVAIGGVCNAAPSPAMDFHTATPCRMVDTRGPGGPYGAPALQPQSQRTFVLTGVCGIPATARSLSVNVTVTQPTAAGSLKLYAGDLPTAPTPTTISFAAGRTRANNAILVLAGDGTGRIVVRSELAGTVHFILDVNGYFE